MSDELPTNLARYARFVGGLGCNRDEIAELFVLSKHHVMELFGPRPTGRYEDIPAGGAKAKHAAPTFAKVGLEPVYPPGSYQHLGTNLYRCADPERFMGWIRGVHGLNADLTLTETLEAALALALLERA